MIYQKNQEMISRLTLFIFFTLVAQNMWCQNESENSFFDHANKFFHTYVHGGKVDYAAINKNRTDLQNLLSQISGFAPDKKEEKAFYINAYNTLVIAGISRKYPVESVSQLSGFFDGRWYDVAGNQVTLEQLEKDFLLDKYKDPRLHFALNCGARSCPDLGDFAYTPLLLESQLEDKCIEALNSPKYVDYSGGILKLSKIFEWYKNDFQKEGVIAFINKYRTSKIPTNTKIYYKSYDWSLNEFVPNINPGKKQSTNLSRYILSATLPKGKIEVKIFNNLYSQSAGQQRATFFTTSMTTLYGLTSRFNLGFIGRYRRVINHGSEESPFGIFSREKTDDSLMFRQGITAFGPAARWSPKPGGSSSFQFSLTFPVGKDLKGSGLLPYIDNQGANLLIQYWDDRNFGSKYSVFTDLGIYWEDIGFDKNKYNNALSIPMTIIGSYYPTDKMTIYGLAGLSVFANIPIDYYYQVGLGAKYRIIPALEFELLVTYFDNKYLQSVDGSAGTYNFGVRYSTW